MAGPAMPTPLAPGSVQAKIAGARLAEPLVRISPTTPSQDLALAQALGAFERRTSSDDYGELTGFVARYPRSGWTPAVFTDLGFAWLHDGYYSRAIDAWTQAWTLGKGASEPHAKAMVDRAFGELIWLRAALGQFDQVSALFEELGKRPITGSATELVQQAREELILSTKDPRHLYNCGPVALGFLMLAVGGHDKSANDLMTARVGPEGASLADLGALADKVKFPYRIIQRQPGQPVPALAVVHWKVGHYGAIIGKAKGRYEIEDAAFPTRTVWVTAAALDAEASGYFLVAGDAPTNAGWREVAVAEAGRIRGKGPANSQRAGDAGDPTANPPQPPCLCNGMAIYNIKESAVGLMLMDTPVGYTPPIGPSTLTQITYNQREDSQPANFNFFNVSGKWTVNWLSYVTDDPTTAGASVSRYLTGGGSYSYFSYVSGTGQFAAQDTDGSILTLVSQSPILYTRSLADGTVETYSQSDGATSYPRNIFLTKVTDPQGNAVTLNYDGQMRLTSLTDATGRQTTLSYENSYWPLLVTKITDPFGRSAVLSYDYSGRLTSITDVLGLTSSFAYDANSLVSSMTTPYGTTSFAYTAPGVSTPRFLQITDPLNYNEREEWTDGVVSDSDPPATVPTGMSITLTNQYLSYRNSFHWDKNQYVLAGCTPTGGCNYAMARDRHFTHPPLPYVPIKWTTIESVKQPLENRIWNSYPGQSLGNYNGSGQSPTGVGRVLDDGTTQLTSFAYDTAGYFKVTQAIDAVGRSTTFNYAANHIDLTSVTQLVSGIQTTLDQFTYNGQHRPLTHIDAGGQTTNFGYNAAGQQTSVTNPLNQMTSYGYNATGDLTSITNANNLNQASFTYDAFDRVASFTDSEGWVATFAYDAADRVTAINYPDGTAETWTYNRLDLASYQDRIGRTWTYAHDADRRLTATTDPAGHQTLYAYNGTNELTSLTDANNHVTQWAYDVEGRLTQKTYADNSTLTFTYEATTSRLKSTTDALNQTRQLTYAQDDRVTGISYVGAVHPTPNVTFAYDPYFPRRTSMTDGSGTTSYSYAPVGSLGALQVQQETTPLATVAYGYDALGRLNSRTVGGQGAETFAYDAIGRLTGHTGDLGSFTLGYLGQSGQVASRALGGSNLATSWTYLTNANDRRLASVTTTGLTAGQSTAFSYTSNAVGQTTGLAQTSDAAIAYPPGSLTQTASYNTLNQLTNLSGQAFTFDANGNLTSDGQRTYTWDAENRLIGIAYPGQPGKATSFAYDGLGRRIQWSSTPAGGGATITSYLWCGPRLCQARNASNAPIRGYYAEGELVPGSASYYYAPDRVGSVRRVFSASAAPAYDYDPYGSALQATATITDFTYAGLVQNGDSALNLATLRPYDPTTGRFLARDPIGEAGDPLGNLYAYVGGDPVDGSDPNGLATLQLGGAGSINLLGASIPLGFGLAIDTQGHFGPYAYAGGGAQLGASAEAGLSLQVSNAQSICDLRRQFYNTSFHGGAGLGGSVDYFTGTSNGAQVFGGGITFGAAGGASASVSSTYTFVGPIW